MSFEQTVEWIGKATDAFGVAVIAVGALFLTSRFLYRLQHGTLVPDAYTLFRQGLGRAILLGLEFLVAGDIIRTVAVTPTFTSVGILAIIVLIRTFLSLELELEIDGRLPWQRKPAPAAPGTEPPERA
jgi:uncharacterized membrane protein